MHESRSISSLGRSDERRPMVLPKFAEYPVSWYLFGDQRELARGPITKFFLGRRLVAFKTQSGQVAVLDAVCSHLAADLGGGDVVGECIRCPYHHWQYDTDGQCTHIPATKNIPTFARQRRYPAVVRHGQIFFFNGRTPLFELPFFPDADPQEFVRAAPFHYELDCPWYMVGANGFDYQHIRSTHDRRLEGTPQVWSPHPHAHAGKMSYVIEGGSFHDRVTRGLCGNRVTLTVTDWCGSLLFVSASFRNTTSYGMTNILPLTPSRVAVQITVFAKRSRNAINRMLFDPLHLMIRRNFIREFTASDAARLSGVRYNPATLIEGDEELKAYFDWLAPVSHGLCAAEVPAEAVA